MPIVNKDNQQEMDRYQQFVRQPPFGKLSQDPAWELVKAGWEGDYVYLEENGQITAAMSVLSVKALDGRYFMYANRGPVSDFHDVETTKRLIAELQPAIDRRNPFLLRIDPECRFDGDLVEAYRSAGFRFRSRETDIHAFIQPRFNMIVDLADMTEDEVLQSFNSKTRYNIRLSDRKGVTTTWARTQEYVDIFYDLTEVMATRQGITHRPKSYFERILAGYPEVRIYVSWFEDEPLSAAVAFPYGDKLFYLYGASSNEHRNLMPNHHMQWEMIRWAIESGKRFYDFGGVFNFTSEDGLYRFKHGFCPESGPTEWIGELDVVFDEELYQRFNG